MPGAHTSRAVELRSAAPEDRDFLLRVYASTREAELEHVPFTPEQKASFYEHQFTAQSLHYEKHYFDTTFDVILAGGEPVGRLIVGRWHDQVRIVDIAILSAFRGQGIGTQVLAPVLTEAEARGVPATIHVERFNPARELYRRLGFVQRSEDDNGVHLLLERRPPTG